MRVLGAASSLGLSWWPLLPIAWVVTQTQSLTCSHNPGIHQAAPVSTEEIRHDTNNLTQTRNQFKGRQEGQITAWDIYRVGLGLPG